jgi:hypothetical protein
MGYWIFQANDKVFRIVDWMKSLGDRTAEWHMRQFFDELKVNDTVFIMDSAETAPERRGIYAVGTIVAKNQRDGLLEPDTGWEYWIDTTQRKRILSFPYIVFRLTRLMTQKPVLLSDIEAVPALKNIPILNFYIRQTVFRLDDTQGKALMDLAERQRYVPDNLSKQASKPGHTMGGFPNTVPQPLLNVAKELIGHWLNNWPNPAPYEIASEPDKPFVNTLPEGLQGGCMPLLVMRSSGQGEFLTRLDQAIRHCNEVCPKETKAIILVTDFWDSALFATRREQFKKLYKEKGIYFRLIMLDSGLSVLPIIP